MALATIIYKPGTFVDRNFIADNVRSGGVIASMGQQRNVELTGDILQFLDFSGEMQIFGEDNPLANDDEKKKKSGEANNWNREIYPVTYQSSMRFSKKFIELATGNGYNKPTGMYYQAGNPASAFLQLLKQPYQKNAQQLFRDYVNTNISRALDYSGIFGVNPFSKNASRIARQNGFLLNTKDEDSSENIKQVIWDKPTSQTPGKTPGADVFASTVRELADSGESAVQCMMTSNFESWLANEQTTIGSPNPLTAGLPLIASNVTIGNVPVTLSRLLPDDAVSQVAGYDNLVIDAILGNFNNRFVWSADPLGGVDVFDTGDPDGKGDLAQVNQVLLRQEIRLAWRFIGGSSKFRVIAHTATAPAAPSGQNTTDNK